MVLEGLAQKLQGALANVSRNSLTINQAAVNQLLKDVTNTLVEADVDFKLALQLRKNLIKKLDFSKMAPGANKYIAIQRALHDELCNLLDPGVPAFKPSRGKTSVVMFVGLQGAGKTTTIMKYAAHYKRKGLRPAVICCDTFRAGAYDQLLMNASRVEVPFYGDKNEKNPVQIALDGVELFKEQGMSLIIVDTSGRSKQATELFEEMREIHDTINPDCSVLVMDGAMGQTAREHAAAFSDCVGVGGCILTKLDHREAKGGAAISAVAETDSPIMFLGTGESEYDLDEFEPRGFAGSLLGMADIPRVIDLVKDSFQNTEQPTKDEIRRITTGQFTFRDFQKQMENVQDMPINKVMGMFGISGMENMGQEKIRHMMVIIDSLTEVELDRPELLLSHKSRKTRIERISRGSGRPLVEVNQLFDVFKNLKKGMMAATGARNQRGMAQQLQRVMSSGRGMPGMPANFDMNAIMKSLSG
eukprot:TRINITY_DN12095_c0_g1_i1.p1 TRINITY_DN12095_c0_g1~~TRINITY_DN12095_c0_g1_i1.p1  ORF type:complete len:473 (-),score=123.65 TRINITY_DN12095_c0_g1_i1:66-1484(-)